MVISDEQQAVLERVYAHLHTHGQWPVLEPLQRQLASEHIDTSVRALANGARDYVAIDSTENHVRLLFRGLAAVPAARPLLEAYVAVIHEMIARYRNPQADARFTASDVEHLDLDEATKIELSRLIQEDQWGLGSGQRGDNWAFDITEQALTAQNVKTIEDLIALRYGESLDETEPTPQPLTTSGQAAAAEADEPISRPEDDLLGRVRLAEVLADQATKQAPKQGFVMGLSGAWGSGKTSLLNLLANIVERDGTGYVVHFDPWLFSSSEELVQRFLREMSAQLNRERRLANVAGQIGEYAEVLAPLSALTPATWAAPVLVIFGRAVGRRRKKVPISAEDQREEVCKALTKLQRRVVILIDDLDRLQAGEIRDVVRLVKLVGDFPNTSYVLAYDQARVAKALGAGEDKEGQAFLEKIVQTSHDIPQASPDLLNQVLVEAISAAIGDILNYRFDQAAFTNIFADGMRALFSTVRDIRRYVNVLPPILALIGKEIELSDVLALEALRVRLPAVFDQIVLARLALTDTHEGVGITVDQQRDAIAKAQIEDVLAEAGGSREEVKAMIERLFPAAQRHLGGSSYGRDWLSSWRRAGRVAHPEVFQIYLNRGLPPGVLSSALVEKAFDNLLDDEILSALLDALDAEELESLLDRLSDYADDFPSQKVDIPISILYNHRHHLRDEKHHVWDFGADFKVGRISLQLLRKLDRDEAEGAVRSALSAINAFTDKGELVRLVGRDDSNGESIVDAAEAAQLQCSFFDGLLSAESDVLARERELANLFWWAHQERPDETNRQVERLVLDDAFLLALLRTATGERIGQGVGEAAVRRSYELNWHELTKLIPVGRLASRVEEMSQGLDAKELDERGAEAIKQALKHAVEVRRRGE